MESSISLSVGENSVHSKVKPKPKPTKVTEHSTIDKKGEKQDIWWVKKHLPEIHLEGLSAKNTESKMKPSSAPLSDVSSSMKEFLEREKMCKVSDEIIIIIT